MSAPVCQWAACSRPAHTFEDGWHHCLKHLREHREEYASVVEEVPAGCGTRSAAMLHRSHGEQPCVWCQAAERAYYRDRARVRRAAAKVSA